QVGTRVQILFYALATVSLYATALGLLDVIGRLGSDFIKRNYLADSARWSESRLYVLIVWAEIVIGSVILLSGVTQPLLVLGLPPRPPSIVTLFYSILIVRLNIRDLPDAIRLRGARLVGMIVAICFYGFFAVGLLIPQIQKLCPTRTLGGCERSYWWRRDRWRSSTTGPNPSPARATWWSGSAGSA